MNRGGHRETEISFDEFDQTDASMGILTEIRMQGDEQATVFTLSWIDGTVVKKVWFPLLVRGGKTMRQR